MAMASENSASRCSPTMASQPNRSSSSSRRKPAAKEEWIQTAGCRPDVLLENSTNAAREGGHDADRHRTADLRSLAPQTPAPFSPVAMINVNI